jgi:hypothetical protein
MATKTQRVAILLDAILTPMNPFELLPMLAPEILTVRPAVAGLSWAILNVFASLSVDFTFAIQYIVGLLKHFRDHTTSDANWRCVGWNTAVDLRVDYFLNWFLSLRLLSLCRNAA